MQRIHLFIDVLVILRSKFGSTSHAFSFLQKVVDPFHVVQINCDERNPHGIAARKLMSWRIQFLSVNHRPL